MPYRYHTLERVIQGYAITGVPLVGSDGHTLSAEPSLDTGIGLYYIVPSIARAVGVSLDAALTIYSVVAVSAGLLLGIAGSFLLFRSPWARSSATLGIVVVSALCLRFGEGYLCGAVAAMATLPFFLHLYREGKLGVLLAALAFVGVVAGAADQFRSLIGAPVLLFILLALALDTAAAPRKRVLCTAVLLLGALLPYAYAAHLAQERDEYVRAAPNARAPAQMGDALWHPVYLGLGYLPNRHGITYSDRAAIDRVRAADPGAPYLSQRYTDVLRRAVFRVVRDDPGLVVRTLAAKAIRILAFLALFANAGLLLALRRPRRWRVEVPFAAAAALAVAPGLVGLPVMHYIAGGLAIAVLYGALWVEAASGSAGPAVRGWIPEPAR